MKTLSTGQHERILRWIFVAWLALQPVRLAAQQSRDAANPQGKWEVLDGSRLTTNNAIDGDSFQVQHKGRDYIFRLYFVDAPETDPSLHERAVDQSAYFGISTNDIPPAGRLAAQFTRSKLAGREFTVITRWQNAGGRSKLVRFYAMVLVNGRNLADDLVAGGLARIYGPHANWPDGPRSVTFVNQLKNSELEARGQQRGLWDTNAFPRSQNFASRTGTPNPSASAPLDLNGASYEDLQKLPGIGPTLAERIIAHRPYRKVDELDKVPGIGPITLDRLRPLVRIVPGNP